MILLGFNSDEKKSDISVRPFLRKAGKLLFLAPALLFSYHGSHLQAQSTGDSYQEGKLYVRFLEGKIDLPKGESRQVPVSMLFPQAKSDINPSAFGVHEFASHLRMFRNPVLERSFELCFDSTGKMESLISQLENDPRVELVERVPLDHPCVVLPSSVHSPLSPQLAEAGAKEGDIPDDPFYGQAEGLNYSWNLDMVGYKEIYGKYQASPDVKVAVVDGAIWGEHEDLGIAPGNMFDVANLTPSSAPPSYVDQQEEGTPTSLSLAILWSHGTHCAGTLAAKTNNGKGIASIGSGVTLLAARTAKDNPDALTNNIDGVQWAIAMGAKVLSLSYTTYTFSETQKEIYESAVRNGVIIIAAAGNSSYDTPTYPASYEGVISVGSLDSDGSRSSFSNYGDWVDVWAPGGYVKENGQILEDNQILSTTFGVTNFYGNRDELKGKYYDAMSGTSMATPLVASMVCLARSYYPEMTAAEAEAALRNSVRGNTVYAPAMMEYLEKNEPGKTVRNPKGYWNPFTRKASLSWESPVVEGVTSYAICKDSVFLASTTDTTYVFDLEDQDARIGVAAVYGTDTAGITIFTLETDTAVEYVVRDPSAVWYPSEEKAVFGWKAPEKGDADLYLIFEAGKEFAKTSELTYEGKVTDTTVVYTVAALFGEDTSYAVPFMFTVGTSINPMSAVSDFEVSVRVNRISRTVTVLTSCEIDGLEVFNAQGMRVYYAKGDNKEFSLPDVAGGIYMVRVTARGGSRTLKFVL